MSSLRVHDGDDHPAGDEVTDMLSSPRVVHVRLTRRG